MEKRSIRRWGGPIQSWEQKLQREPFQPSQSQL